MLRAIGLLLIRFASHLAWEGLFLDPETFLICNNVVFCFLSLPSIFALKHFFSSGT